MHRENDRARVLSSNFVVWAGEFFFQPVFSYVYFILLYLECALKFWRDLMRLQNYVKDDKHANCCCAVCT